MSVMTFNNEIFVGGVGCAESSGAESLGAESSGAEGLGAESLGTETTVSLFSVILVVKRSKEWFDPTIQKFKS